MNNNDFRDRLKPWNHSVAAPAVMKVADIDGYHECKELDAIVRIEMYLDDVDMETVLRNPLVVEKLMPQRTEKKETS